MLPSDTQATVTPVRLNTVSPTQLKEADPENGCLRYWFFKKIERRPYPEKDWLAMGTNIHAPLEIYLKTGLLPDESNEHYHKVLAATQYLPTPGPDLFVELAAKIPTYEGGPLLSMKIDLADPRDPEILHILDHKSTSDIANKKGNLLTPTTLLEDPQMLAYAQWGYATQQHHMVDVSHFYISSTHKGRCLPPVTAKVPRDLCEEKFSDTLVQIRSMVALAEAPPQWTDVPARKKAATCSRYGGCPFLSLCTQVDPWIGVQMSNGNESSDFLASLMAMTNNVEPVAADGVPHPEEPTFEVSDLLKQLTAEQKFYSDVDSAAKTFADVATVQADLVPLLPPDAPSRMTPAAEEKPAKAPKKAKKTSTDTTAGHITKRFDYKIDRETTHATEEYLIAHGDEGWQLVGFDGNGYVFVRERAVQ